MVKPSQLHLSRPKALALVRELASDSGNVIFVPHALQRMRQRRVSPQRVIACLLRGVIVEGPSQGLKGNWEMAFERFAAGERLRVAVAIDLPKRLIVITVYDTKN